MFVFWQITNCWHLHLIQYSQEIACSFLNQPHLYNSQTTRQCVYVFFQNWIRPVLNENCFDHCFGQLFNNFNFFTGCWASIIMYAHIFWYSTITHQFFHQTASNNNILYFCGNLFWLKTSYTNLLNDGGLYWFEILLDSFRSSFDCFFSKNWLAEITNFLIIESFYSTFLNKSTKIRYSSFLLCELNSSWFIMLIIKIY